MKKIVALLLGLLMVFAVCTATAEAVTAQPGDKLSFDISITAASGTDAKIGIKTNGAPVTFESATGGPTNDVVPPKSFDGFFVLINDAGVTIPGNGGAITGKPEGPVTLETGKVGTVTFTVNAAATAGTYTVEAYKKDGSITVEGSITFTVAGAATGDRVPGDVNEDGEVDSMDSLLLDRYLADWGNSINMSNADVNADGEVDSMDALLLDRYLADWDVKLI